MLHIYIYIYIYIYDISRLRVKSCVIWLTVFFLLILKAIELCNAGVCTSCLVLVESQCFVNIEILQFGMCAVPGTMVWLPTKLAYVLCKTVL